MPAPVCGPASEEMVTPPERPIAERITRLRGCAAAIRMTPPLWPAWWLLWRTWESELDALEDAFRRSPQAPSPSYAGNVVCLAAWRREHTREFA